MGSFGSILVVDDERIVTLDVARMLRREGYDPQTAQDASTALRIAKTACPDVILIDLYLGETDGVSLIPRLREQCPDSVFIVMSARADTEAAIRSMSEGVHDFLIKPFTRDHLSVVMQRSLDRVELTIRRRNAEHALRDRNRELLSINERLQQSERKYRELFRYSPAIIFITGPDGTFVEVNKTALDALGYQEHELTGRPAVEFMTSQSQELLHKYWDRIIGGKPLPAMEYEFLTKEGQIRYFDVRAGSRHQLYKGETLIGVLSQFTDVTELRHTRRREEQQREELYQAAKLASLGTLLSGVAHEINNPNNFIRMSIDNVRDFWNDAEKLLDGVTEEGKAFTLGGIPYNRSREMVKKMIASIRGGSERIERLVTDLKDFARPSEGSQVHREDLNEILHAAVEIVGATIRQATTRFTTTLPEEPVVVQCRRQQVEQVIINLITNSCQALTNKNQAIRVSIVQNRERMYAELVVEDEGRGISPDVLGNVTDPFFTTRRGEGGTGLGLAVSQRIIADHSGIMEFESLQGEGTRATVRLPLTIDTPLSDRVYGEVI